MSSVTFNLLSTYLLHISDSSMIFLNKVEQFQRQHETEKYEEDQDTGEKDKTVVKSPSDLLILLRLIFC